MARYTRHKKIKRYHRSFYTPAMQVRRAVSVAVLVAAVLALAWFAAPHVLDWATHTWYTVVRGRDLEAESSSRAAAQAASEAAAASKESAAGETAADKAARQAAARQALAQQAAETPQADGTAVAAGTWAAVERSALGDEASIRAAAQQLAAQGVTYALVTLKDSAGSIYYASGVAAAASGVADQTIDPALVASVFKEEGLVPVAQLAAFRDPVAGYADRSMAIRYRSDAGSDYLWLDAANAAAGGKSWLNPYSSEAVNFVGDLVAEVHGMGFDHVCLACVQFPSAVSAKQDFGSTGGVGRAQQLAADIAAWQARFDGAVTLWLRYSYAECTASPSTLGAPAVQLGMQNLLADASGSALDAAQRAALTDAAAAAGVQHVVVKDEGGFE